MAQVAIQAETYSSLVGLSVASNYLAADDRFADAWEALDDDEKGRKLVMVTRIMLRQPWRNVLDLDALPAAVIEAACEFAGELSIGYDPGIVPSAAQSIRRQKAGSVEVEYFRDLDNPLYRPPPLPPAVWELIKPLLKGQDGTDGFLPGSFSTGTCGRSVTERDRRYDRSRYYGFGIGDRDYD